MSLEKSETSFPSTPPPFSEALHSPLSPVHLDVGAAGQDDDSKEERDQAPGHDARDPDQGHDECACICMPGGKQGRGGGLARSELGRRQSRVRGRTRSTHSAEEGQYGLIMVLEQALHPLLFSPQTTRDAQSPSCSQYRVPVHRPPAPPASGITCVRLGSESNNDVRELQIT